MRMYRCDRCGTDFAIPPGEYVRPSDIEPFRFFPDHEYDLCKACRAALEQWIARLSPETGTLKEDPVDAALRSQLTAEYEEKLAENGLRPAFDWYAHNHSETTPCVKLCPAFAEKETT